MSEWNRNKTLRQDMKFLIEKHTFGEDLRGAVFVGLLMLRMYRQFVITRHVVLHVHLIQFFITIM